MTFLGLDPGVNHQSSNQARARKQKPTGHRCPSIATHSRTYANMSTDTEEKLLVVFDAIRIFLLPCAWLESLCLSMLNIDVATTFRMFPTHGPHPGYSVSERNALALVMMLLVPWLVASEATRPSYTAPVAWLLRPFARCCSCLGAHVLMFLRVWLYMAFSTIMLRSSFMTLFEWSSVVSRSRP